MLFHAELAEEIHAENAENRQKFGSHVRSASGYFIVETLS